MDVRQKLDRLYASALPTALQLPIFNIVGQLKKKKEKRSKPLCFVVGLPRSGTHTLSDMFPSNISSHEPLPFLSITTLLKWKSAKITEGQLCKFLESRDYIKGARLEASHFMHYFVEGLAKNDKDSRFILTIREPKSWLYSEVNQNYVINRTKRKTIWRRLEEYRYGSYAHQAEAWDNDLIQLKLWPIRSYFSYWRDHISFVLNNVPPDRILIVDVTQITEQTKKIEDFVLEAAVNSRLRSGKFSKPVHRSDFPDPMILDTVIQEECASAMDLLKSNVKSPPDWLLRL